jgi:hypothetical protein
VSALQKSSQKHFTMSGAWADEDGDLPPPPVMEAPVGDSGGGGGGGGDSAPPAAAALGPG